MGRRGVLFMIKTHYFVKYYGGRTKFSCGTDFRNSLNFIFYLSSEKSQSRTSRSESEERARQLAQQPEQTQFAVRKDMTNPSPTSPYSAVKDEEEQLSRNSETKDMNFKTENKTCKTIVSKGSKKWLGAGSFIDKTDPRYKSIFRHENSNASLLVEAAISAAEKDIIDKPDMKKDISSDHGESLMESSSEMYSVNQYMSSSSVVYEHDKKSEVYEKIPDSPMAESFHEMEHKKNLSAHDKSNLSDILKCNTLLRINTTPLNEIPKDYNINAIIRGHEAESLTDIEIHEYRNRDFLETYKENESFHEPYRNHEIYRSDKLELYRSEPEFRITSVDKFEYRDIDLSNECYRNLASNLDKYRTADAYRLREGYELGAYRESSEDRDGEVQNLCLKEKSLQMDLTYKQYETLEELARIGRDNPGKDISKGIYVDNDLNAPYFFLFKKKFLFAALY